MSSRKESLDTMVNNTILVLQEIKSTKIGGPTLEAIVKKDALIKIANAFEHYEEMICVSESIKKIAEITQKPYLFEVQLGKIIDHLLYLKTGESLLSKFSYN